MATPSEVKAGLDDISAAIRAERRAAIQAKARMSQVETLLNAIPTTFADVIDTVNGYDGADGTFEAVAKDELANLTTEFLALRAKATSAKTGLAAIDFTT